MLSKIKTNTVKYFLTSLLVAASFGTNAIELDFDIYNIGDNGGVGPNNGDNERFTDCGNTLITYHEFGVKGGLHHAQTGSEYEQTEFDEGRSYTTIRTAENRTINNNISQWNNYIGIKLEFNAASGEQCFYPRDIIRISDFDGTDFSQNLEIGSVFGYNGNTLVKPTITGGKNLILSSFKLNNTPANNLLPNGAEYPNRIITGVSRGLYKSSEDDAISPGDPRGELIADFGEQCITDLFYIWGIQNNTNRSGLQRSAISLKANCRTDWGDAPDGYQTAKGEGGKRSGAVHHLTDYTQSPSETLSLNTVSNEQEGIPSVNADTDNQDDAVPEFPKVDFSPDGLQNYTITGIKVTNQTDEQNKLCGAIDFDLDGNTNNGGFHRSEFSCVTVPLPSTSNADCKPVNNQTYTHECELTWTEPSDFNHAAALNTPTYARIRLGPLEGDTSEFVDLPRGYVYRGEVEDYRIDENTFTSNIDLKKEVLSGPTKNNNGTYTVKYRITAQNTGADGSYDLIDNFKPGDGISLNSATITYQNAISTDSNDRNLSANKAITNGATIVNDERLRSGKKDVYVITAIFDVIAKEITSQSGNCNLINSESGTGFYNEVSGSDTDTNANNDNACVSIDPLPQIELSKEVQSGPEKNNDGTYTVVYRLSAENIGGANGNYDLMDTFRPGDGITLNSAEIRYVSGASTDSNDRGLPDGWSVTSGETIIFNELVRAGKKDVFDVTAIFDVNAKGLSNQSGNCDLLGSESGTGFYNKVSGSDTDSNATDDNACANIAPLAQIELSKVVRSGPNKNNDGTYTVQYRLSAENVGGANGNYDLLDTFSPGDGITLNNAKIRYLGEVSTDRNDSGLPLDWSVTSGETIIFNELVRAGKKDVYDLTANFTIDAKVLTTQSGNCNLINSEPGTGFYNEVSGSDSDSNVSNDNACVSIEPLPQIELSKEIQSDPVKNNDGTYTVVYRLTALNEGNADGTYDLVDTFSPGEGISLNSAEIRYVGGAGTDRNDTGLSAGTSFTSGETILTAEIGAGKREVYEVTADFSVDAKVLSSQSGNCNLLDSESGTGFYNQVSGSDSDSNANDDNACASIEPLAQIELRKEVRSGPDKNNDGSYTVIYRLIAENEGNADGNYDLIDTFSLGEGIALNSAEIRYVGGAGTDRNDTGLSAGTSFTSGETILTAEVGAGKREVYEVTAEFSVDAKLLTTESGNCDLLGNESGTGFYNEVSGSDSDSNANDNSACASIEAISQIELDKVVIRSGPVKNSDGTYTVFYRIRANNVGNADGNYDLVDTFRPGDGISLNSAEIEYVEAASSDSNDNGLSAGTSINSGDTILNDELLRAGKREVYDVTAIFTVDAKELTSESGDCNLLVNETGSGFYNEVSGSDTDTDESDNNGCASIDPLPQIELTKTVLSPFQSNTQNTFRISYLITAENFGNGDGTYDLIDTFSPSDTVRFRSASINYLDAESTDSNDTNLPPDTPVTSGVKILDDETLRAGKKESYEVLVIYDTQGPNIESTYSCGVGEPKPGTGLYNEVSGSDTDISTRNNKACESIGTFSDMLFIKSAESLERNSDGTYTVSYLINARNRSDRVIYFDVIDTIKPGVGITLIESRAAYVSVNNSRTNSTISNPITNGEAFVVGEGLNGKRNESWRITAKFAVDMTKLTKESGDCNLTGSESGTGFYNEVSGIQGEEDVTDNISCLSIEPSAQIELSKIVSSGPVKNNDGTYTVVYRVSAENVGNVDGNYNLVDTIRPGEGISLNSANIRYDSRLSTDRNDSDLLAGSAITSGEMILNDELLRKGKRDVYEVVANFDVDAKVLSDQSGDCSLSNNEPGTGFYNEVSGSDSDSNVNNDNACVSIDPLPQIELSKEVESGPIKNNDGSYTVTYLITAENVGGANAEYDVIDTIKPGEGISLIEANAEYVSINGTSSNATISNPIVNGEAFVVGERTATGRKESWRITATFSVDSKKLTTESGDCNLEETESGTGFYNEASGGFGDSNINDNNACVSLAPFPQIELNKMILSGPTENNDGSYTVTYRIRAANVGSANGTYDLIDTIKPGEGISLREASIRYMATSTDPSDSDIATDIDGTPITNGAAIFTDEPLSVGNTEIYIISAVFDIDPKELTSESGECDLQSTETGTGFYNEISGSDSDTEAADNASCVSIDPLPQIELTKLAGEVQKHSSDTYSVIYQISASNLGNGVGQYDLVDTFQAGAGIELRRATIDYLFGENNDNNIADNTIFTSGETIFENELLSGKTTEHWVVVAVFELNASVVTTESGDCNLSNDETGTGFYNEASGSVSETDSSDNFDCVDIEPQPLIDLSKTATEPVRNADGTYSVSYTLTAENTGNADGSYDLVDTFKLGEGISLKIASISYGTGETNNTGLVNNTKVVSGEVIITEESLAAGAKETWVINAVFTINANTLTESSGDCDFDNGEPGSGFYNEVSGSDTEIVTTNNSACKTIALHPQIELTKEVTSQPLKNEDGSYTVVYSITANNQGNGLGTYNVIDVFKPGKGISLNSATITYQSINGSTTDGVINNPMISGLAAVENASLDADESDAWQVTATYTVENASLTVQSSDCNFVLGESGTGFRNEVSGSESETDLTDNNDCAVMPLVEIKKTDGKIESYDATTDRYTVSYQISVENRGNTDAVYDITESIAPGVGIQFVANSGVVAAVSGTTTNGAIVSQFNSGDEIVSNELILAKSKEIWNVTAQFIVDNSQITDKSRDCVIDENETTSGFGNVVSGSADILENNNIACVALPSVNIELTKTVQTQPVKQSDGTYTVVYQIVAQNKGGVVGFYDVIDTFDLSSAFSLNSAKIQYDGGENNDNNISPEGVNFNSGDSVIVAERLLADNTSPPNSYPTESWLVTANFSLDKNAVDATTFQCQKNAAGIASKGLANNVSGSDSETVITDNGACPIMPIIELSKSIISADYVSGNNYRLTYIVNVKNIGSSEGLYDLIDTLNLGEGISLIDTMSVSYQSIGGGGVQGEDKDGNANSFNASIDSGGTIVANELLVAGDQERWKITANVSVNQVIVQAQGSADCELDALTGHYSNAFSNNISGSQSELDTSNNDACLDVPLIEVSKRAGKIEAYDPVTKQYTASFFLTAINHGNRDGVYSITDTLELGEGVNFVANSAKMVAADGVVTNSVIPSTYVSGDTVISNEIILAGETETWNVLGDFTVDQSKITPESADCDTENGTEASGVGNSIVGNLDIDPGNNFVCIEVPLASIEISKTAGNVSYNKANDVYTVDYQVTVENSGNGAGIYSIADTFKLGEGISFIANSGEVTPISGTSLSQEGILKRSFNSGDVIITNDSIADSTTKTWKVSAKFKVDIKTMTPQSADCVIDNVDDLSGFGNKIDGPFDSNLTNNFACVAVPIPSIEIAKIAGQIVNFDQKTGEYTVSYDIVVTNSSDGPGSYNVIDNLSPGLGINFVSDSGSISVEGDNVLNGSLTSPFDSGDQIISNQAIGAQSKQVWHVSSKFTIDHFEYTESSGDCIVDSNETSSGFTNSISSTEDIDLSNNSACVPVPQSNIEISKRAINALSIGIDTYRVTYVIVVNNLGTGSGFYDVTDTTENFPGVTFIADSGLLAASNGTEVLSGSFKPNFDSGDTIIDQDFIAGLSKKQWAVSVDFNVNPALISSDAGNVEKCKNNDPTTTTGFVNQISGSKDNNFDNNFACLPVPPVGVEILKQPGKIEAYDEVTGIYTISYYAVAVSNDGGTSYSITDTLDPGAGINFVSNSGTIEGPFGSGNYEISKSNFDSGELVVDNQTIDSNTTHYWFITSDFTIDVNLFNPDNLDCESEQTESTGFANSISGRDFNLDNNLACVSAPKPNIEISKVANDITYKSQNADGKSIYSVSYTINVENNSDGPGRYSVVDTANPGLGITFVEDTGRISAGMGTIAQGGTIQSFFNSGDTVISDDGIKGRGKKTWEVIMDFEISPSVITDSSANCDTGGNTVPSGFSNELSANQDTNEENNYACLPAPIADIEISKQAGEILNYDVGTGTYTVSYIVTVSNNGNGLGIYDVVDTLVPGEGISFVENSGRLVPDGFIPDNSGYLASFDSGEMIVSNELIVANETEQWNVQAEFILDFDLLTKSSGDCNLEVGESSTGFGNNISGSFDRDLDNNDACLAVPKASIDIKKEAVDGSVEYNSVDNTYSASYLITVTNSGDGPGTYDVIENIEPGPGISFVSNSGSVIAQDGTSLSNTNAIVTSPFTSPARIISNDIVAGKQTKVWLVKAKFTVDPTVVTSLSANCIIEEGETTSGFGNAIRGQADSISTNNHACLNVPLASVDIQKNAGSIINYDSDLGRYTVSFNIVATNSGDGVGIYEIIDTPAPILGITFVPDSGRLSPNGFIPDSKVDYLATFTSGDKIVDSELIAAKSSETWDITMEFDVNPDELSQAEMVCEQSLGLISTEFGNTISGLYDTDKTNNEACVPVPSSEIEISKTGNSVSYDKVRGIYIVTYDISVSNLGQGPGIYSITDTFSPGAGITLINNTASITPSNDTHVNSEPNSPFSSGDMIITNEAIAAQQSEYWVVTAQFKVDPTILTAESADCDADDASEHTGFGNDISGDDIDLTNNHGCVEVPLANIDISKTAGSLSYDKSTERYTVSYHVSATNTGQGLGIYNVTDHFELGQGINYVVDSARLEPESTSESNIFIPDSDYLEEFNSGDKIIDGERIAPNSSETWLVTADFTIDKSMITIETADCDTNGGLEFSGFGNNIEGEYDNDANNNDACIVVPIFNLTKQIKSGPTRISDSLDINVGKYKVEYSILVNNAGLTEISYDIVDDLSHIGAGISFSNGSIIFDGGIHATADVAKKMNGGSQKLVTNAVIAPQTMESWTVVVYFDVDVQLVASNNSETCIVDHREAHYSGGFMNLVSSEDVDESSIADNDACQGMPLIDLSKSVFSGPTLIGGSNEETTKYEVIYRINASNTGGLVGTYDIIDNLSNTGKGIEFFSGKVTYVGGSDTGSDGDIIASGEMQDKNEILVKNESLLPGESEVWELAVIFDISLDELDFNKSGECDTNMSDGIQSGGFLNLITGSATDTITDNGNACVSYSDYSALGDIVWCDCNANGVFDSVGGESELGFADVELELTRIDHNGVYVANTVRKATTNASGYYIFENILPGQYRVQVDKSTLPNEGKELEVTYSKGDMLSSHALVNVGLNERVLDVDFGYVTYAQIGDTVWLDQGLDDEAKTGSSNQIKDEWEQGLSSVKVTLTGFDKFGNELPERIDYTDFDGLYLFDKVVPGTYVVSVDIDNIIDKLNKKPKDIIRTYDADGLNDSLDHSELTLDFNCLTAANKDFSEDVTPDNNYTDRRSILTQDFGYDIAPVTYAEITNYKMMSTDDDITINFDTIKERENLGFQILGRSDGLEDYIEISEFIESQCEGFGAKYNFTVDNNFNGKSLKEVIVRSIDFSGVESEFGPFKVEDK